MESSGLRPVTLLNILQCTGLSPSKTLSVQNFNSKEAEKTWAIAWGEGRDGEGVNWNWILKGQAKGFHIFL